MYIYAGPGVILSFVFAAFVTLANALIYAEFGSYIPHTGAAYTYIFCSVNELAAFAAGWMALFGEVWIIILCCVLILISKRLAILSRPTELKRIKHVHALSAFMYD